MAQLKHTCLLVISLGLLSGSIAACAQGERATTDSSAETVETAVTKSEAEKRAGKPKGSGEQLEFAQTDLSRRLSVEAGDIEVKTVRHVHWRSGATGCPKPGMSYTMGIVPGVLIVLAVEGKVFRYHAKRDGWPFHCPSDRVEAPALGPGEEAF